jgi:subtilase family serine protease
VVEITDLRLFLKMLSMFLDIQQVGKSNQGEKRGSSSNLLIVALPVAIILGAIIVPIVLALLLIRARKIKKKLNIKPNEV